MKSKISKTTLESLMMIAMNKCASCKYTNICVHVMREKCINEIIKEQLK